MRTVIRTIATFWLGLFLLFFTAGVAPARADDTPLIVIRFNTNPVAYEHSLKRAINAALNIKPTTFFDVVAVVPEGNNSRNKDASQKTAEVHAQHIVDQISDSGITSDRIRITYQTSSLIPYDEVHVFVR